MTETDRVFCELALENMLCDADRLLHTGISTRGMVFEIGDGLMDLLAEAAYKPWHCREFDIFGIRAVRVPHQGKAKFSYELKQIGGAVCLTSRN